MRHHIDYFFGPQSPWTYLGHQRFTEIAREAGALVRVCPADLGKVFAVSGGLPLGKRALQRQAYRLVELKRWSEFLDLPLMIQPTFFPVAGDDAARVIIAVEHKHGSDAALAITGRVLAAVWVQQRDIANTAVLSELLHEAGLQAGLMEESRSAAVQARYEDNTQRAIDAGVFGAPSYVADGEIFWGQDRLDFLARKLQSDRN